MSYTRFVIISHLRSGTHLLRTMLESHPEIICQTEVFNSDNRNAPYPLSTPTREILNKWVYCDFPATISCAGFVLQAYHPWGLKAFPGIRDNPDWANIWPLLQNMPGLRVIHLHRQNLLRRHLSHIMARNTGDWHDWNRDRVSSVSHIEKPIITSPDRSNRPCVTLDPKLLQLDFEETEKIHQRVTEQFLGLNYFALSYEQLCEEPEQMGNKLLKFLGVTKTPLQAAVSKIEHRSLDSSIKNYAELKQVFSDTRWHSFF